MTRRDPTDLISEDVWQGIMHLPDDVVLTTANHRGTQLAAMHSLWGEWIEACGHDREEELFEAMVDVTDCFSVNYV